MVSKTSRTPAKAAKKAVARRVAASAKRPSAKDTKPALLSGGNPQIAKAEGDAPVLAYFGLQNLRIGEAAAVSVSMLPVFAILAFIVTKLLQEE